MSSSRETLVTPDGSYHYRGLEIQNSPLGDLKIPKPFEFWHTTTQLRVHSNSSEGLEIKGGRFSGGFLRCHVHHISFTEPLVLYGLLWEFL